MHMFSIAKYSLSCAQQKKRRQVIDTIMAEFGNPLCFFNESFKRLTEQYCYVVDWTDFLKLN